MADRPIIVAGSIPSADFGRLAEELRAVDADGPDWIHTDVTDGRCVPNISFEPGGAGGRAAGEGGAAHHLADFARAGARIHLTYPALKAPDMRPFWWWATTGRRSWVGCYSATRASWRLACIPASICGYTPTPKPGAPHD